MSYVPYFKPTRRKHQSGFRIFEIGYINSSNKKVVLGEFSDAIHNWMYPLEKPLGFTLDIAPGGEIRVLTRVSGDKLIRWSSMSMSDAILEIGDPNKHVMQLEEL